MHRKAPATQWETVAYRKTAWENERDRQTDRHTDRQSDACCSLGTALIWALLRLNIVLLMCKWSFRTQTSFRRLPLINGVRWLSSKHRPIGISQLTNPSLTSDSAWVTSRPVLSANDVTVMILWERSINTTQKRNLIPGFGRLLIQFQSQCQIYILDINTLSHSRSRPAIVIQNNSFARKQIWR